METFSQHIDVIVFLSMSIGVVLISQRLHVNTILTYLLTGVVMGPHVANLINNPDHSKSIAEFGVIFLLFTIGLELPWERLRELKRYVFGLGSLQMFATGTILGGIIYWLSDSVEMAVILGGGLAVSSTAVVMQLLTDSNELTSRPGRIAFSVLIFQDIAVVILLVWVSTIGVGEEKSVLYTLSQTAIRAIIVLVAIAFIGHYILRPIYRVVAQTRNTEIFMATSLLIILTTGCATAAANLSMELGAFLAGVLLAETEYRHQIEADIRPFKALLLGIFFMTVGMGINPQVMQEQFGLIMAITATIIVVKGLIVFLLSRLFTITMTNAIKLAFILSTGSEFIFVIFAQSMESNLISADLVQVVNIAVIMTMTLAPLLLYVGHKIGDHFSTSLGVAIKAAEEETKDMRHHVIIAGYGRVGQTVHALLRDHMIPHVIIDLNMARVTIGRTQESVPLYFGDARRIEVYRALGIERAKAVVITLNEFASATRAVVNLRRYFPGVQVFVRVQDSSQAYKLKEIGAQPVMPEAFAPSFQLVSAILNLFGVPVEQINQTISTFRKKNLSASSFAKGEVPWIQNDSLEELREKPVGDPSK